MLVDGNLHLGAEHTHVDSELAEIRVQLTREAQAGSDTRHDEGHKVVEVSVSRGRKLEGPEANVVEGLIVDTESLIRVFHELVNRQGGIVGLYKERKYNVIRER